MKYICKECGNIEDSLSLIRLSVYTAVTSFAACFILIGWLYKSSFTLVIVGIIMGFISIFIILPILKVPFCCCKCKNEDKIPLDSVEGIDIYNKFNKS